MTQRFRILPLACAAAVALPSLWFAVAQAQSTSGQPPAPPAPVQGQYSPPPPQAQNPVCARLETQLASVERGGGDPSRAAAVQRYQDTVTQQQSNLDRLNTQSSRLGCRNAGIFSIFTPQPPQCSSLSTQIDQARSAVDHAISDLQRAQSGGGNDLESQRQSVIAALAQNNCGPQYRAAAGPQRGVFETIFGGANTNYNGIDVSQGGSFRTLCVRSCDGYYYPISFATSPAHFAEDEQTCRNTCPAAEVTLYSHRTNEDVRSAATVQGRRYIDLPNAFKYRQTFDPTCSCRRPGQSWAEALGQAPDRTLVRGDIIITDDKNKSATPQQQQPSAQTSQAAPPNSRVVQPQEAPQLRPGYPSPDVSQPPPPPPVRQYIPPDINTPR